MSFITDFIDLFLVDSKEWNGVHGWEKYPAGYVNKHFYVFFIAGAIYLPMVWFLRKAMKDRQPFVLQYPLIIWNFLMTTFSTFGAYYALLPLFAYASYDADKRPELICDAWCYSFGGSAKWIFLFNVSKIFEFVDTIFLCLRKRPIPFLHWYHHIITYCFCIYSGQSCYVVGICSGYLFCLMNFCVHSVMYGYYFLRSLHIRPPFDYVITTMQILQMVLGVAIIYVTSTCSGEKDWFGIYFGYAIYFSFFLLFCDIFYRRYLVSAPPPKKQQPKTHSKDKKKM